MLPASKPAIPRACLLYTSKTKLVDMDLSVRALNCLKAADVETLGDLVQFNKTDLLK